MKRKHVYGDGTISFQHECEPKNKLASCAEIEKPGYLNPNGWELCNDDAVYSMTIIFCPFCGVNLDEESIGEEILTGSPEPSRPETVMNRMAEKCHFHPDRDAIRWRETMIIGEPERVPLCPECCDESRLMGFSVYPLDERRRQLLDER
jgi:hypothetical protein